MDNQMSNGPEAAGYGRDALGLHSCGGDCLNKATEALEAARQLAQEMGCGLKDINKRFDYLLDLTVKSRHDRAEVIYEQALAIYEVAYGQEHPTVAHMLNVLAQLQAAHGKEEYSRYLQSWGSDILTALRQEPQHDFFNLFGYSEQPEEQLPNG